MHSLVLLIHKLSPTCSIDLANVSLALYRKCAKLLSTVRQGALTGNGNSVGLKPKDLCQVDVARARAAKGLPAAS